MGSGDDTTAAHRLRLLVTEFTQPECSGPGDGRAPTMAHSPAPLRLSIIDHIGASRDEIVARTHAYAPDAGPAPADTSRIYDWMRDHTEHLGPERAAAREQVIYRQGLEHAIAMGDHKTIRRHPCPGCGCWGLFWDTASQLAVCTYPPCIDDQLMASTWTLSRLAYEHIASQKKLKSSAT